MSQGRDMSWWQWKGKGAPFNLPLRPRANTGGFVGVVPGDLNDLGVGESLFVLKVALLDISV